MAIYPNIKGFRIWELSPINAAAYSCLANNYSLLASYGFVAPNDAFPRANDATQKALEIDDTFVEADASLGSFESQYECDWLGAAAEFQRAI